MVAVKNDDDADNNLKDRPMTTTPISGYKYNRSLNNALANGAKSKCPSCGEGNLFDGFLKIKDSCETCGENLSHHRADDLPPYLNILLVGHIVVGFLMVAMKYEWFGVWPTAIGGSVLALVISLALMRPIKGMVVGFQWALEMHGFGDNED
ncbi:MAG: DUF983 domain-containing protein [Rhizobiaceae bacterium]|nr:DUF983 domain-containing protein [Rhizobiaceae bacterium]